MSSRHLFSVRWIGMWPSFDRSYVQFKHWLTDSILVYRFEVNMKLLYSIYISLFRRSINVIPMPSKMLLLYVAVFFSR